MIRLAAAAVVGCLLAGLFEALRAGGGGLTAVTAVGLTVCAAPVVFAALLALRALWSSPALVAARAPAGRAGGVAAALLFGGGLLALRIGTGRLVAAFVDAARQPALIAPAAAGVAVVLTVALVAVAMMIFGPLRALVARLGLDRPAPAAALALAALGLVAGAALPPALEVGQDLPPWPAVTAALSVVAGVLAYVPLARRSALANIAIALAGLALAGFALSAARGHPEVEQALTDAHGLGALLTPWVGPEAPPPPPAPPPAEAAAETPPPPDEGPPVHHGPLPPALDRPWNVLVVTIDTVRADHLPLYGYARDTAPHLTALGERSAVFERAYTSVNATRWLLPSLFTGRMPGDIDHVHAGHYVLLQPGSGEIFGRLRQAGWHTEAHNAEQLRDGMWFGLEAGFDVYAGDPEITLRDRSTDALAGAFERALDRFEAEGPADRWAMWVHLLDPHEPYLAHDAFPFGDETIDRYDAEIAAADAGLGRMLEALEDRDLADSTIVVVTSDHGEEFGEHGRKFHGKQLFEESIRVPLVMHVPGLAPRRLAAPVSLIDVAPTIAHLTGLPPGRSPGLDGHRARSLVGVMAGGPEDTDRAVFVDCIRDAVHADKRRMAMVRGHDKIIVDQGGVDGRTARFYDLAADPREEDNLRWTASARYDAAAGLFRAEIERRRENQRARLLHRHVSTTAPALDTEPVVIRPGLELLGSRVDPLPRLDRRLPILRTWFRVTGPLPDLRLRHDYLDEAGRRLKRKTYRPLQGLYRTSAWRPGQVIEDVRLVRFRPAPRRYAQVMLTVLEGKREIFGPHRLGRVVPDVRTVDDAPEAPREGSARARAGQKTRNGRLAAPAAPERPD